jgi:4-oxalocrotonate tautomerase
MMPFVNIKVIEGVFSSDEKHEMATALADVMVEFEGSGAFCEVV